MKGLLTGGLEVILNVALPGDTNTEPGITIAKVVISRSALPGIITMFPGTATVGAKVVKVKTADPGITT